jgi:CRISPR type IV-associated protein Csf3
MQNLKIIANISTPVVTNGLDYFILDSMLQYAVIMNENKFKSIMRNENSKIFDNIELPLHKLILNDNKYVWKASFGMYSNNCKEITDDYWTKRYPIENANLLSVDEKKSKIVIGSGKYKSFKMPLIEKLINKVIWYACGDKAEIELLLNKYINNIGKKSSYGYGMITSWEIQEIDKDYSIFIENNNEYILTRNIPYTIDEFKKYKCNIVDFRLNPPYWHNDNKIKCLIPY